MAEPDSKTERALMLLQRHEAMKSDRETWSTLWQDIANHVMPRKSNIVSRLTEPSTAKENQLFDSTAIRSNQILANGQLSWMTPADARWFTFDPPYELTQSDEVKQWFQRCSEIAQNALAQSNFYSEMHEMYLDRGAFGTAVIHCEAGRKTPLTFSTWEVGSYSIAEDDEGLVDTAYRELEMTLRQASLQFGPENLSEKLQKQLALKDGKALDKKHKFVHCIHPREPEKVNYSKLLDPLSFPIASVYLECESKHIVQEAGYKEQPFMATRYLKWGGAVYGWSPSWMALPEARQLNFLEKQMDALAELTAFPRMLIPSTHEGDIDFRAAGVTYYDPSNPNAIPREWATAGRYDVGKDRSDVKRRAIEDAYHVDLFQMFGRLDKQMTAREVSERSSEKLVQFSPTFARMTTELFNPQLSRVFNLLLRGGHFPPPPREAIIQDGNGAYLPEPRVSYNSRIALAIKSLDNTAFGRSMEMLLPLSNVRPDILDNYDFDRITRDASRNDGLPADWMLPVEAVEQIRQQRAAAQAQQAQAEQAALMADAAGKVGGIKNDSAVVKMLEDAA